MNRAAARRQIDWMGKMNAKPRSCLTLVGFTMAWALVSAWSSSAAVATSQRGAISVKCQGLKGGAKARVLLSRHTGARVPIACGSSRNGLPEGKYTVSATSGETTNKLYVPKAWPRQVTIRRLHATSVSVKFSSKLKPDVVAYFKTMARFASDEQSLLDRYRAVSGVNYTDDLTMATALYGLIPDANQFIASIEGVRTPTTDLLEAHGLYLQAWNESVEGMTLLMSALNSQDYSVLAQANAALSTGRDLMRQTLRAWTAIKAGP